MCRSVPQMAVFSTLTRTSLGPGTGTGTSCIQMPLPGSRLTSAFIIADIRRSTVGEGPRLYARGYTRPDCPTRSDPHAADPENPCIRTRGVRRPGPGGRGHVGAAAASRNRRPAAEGRAGTAAGAARRPHRAADGRGGFPGWMHGELRVAPGPGGDEPPLRVRQPAVEFHAGEEPDRNRLQCRDARG